MPRHRNQHKNKRQKKKLAAKPYTGKATIDHPKYGKVPLIRREWFVSNGKTYSFPDYDPAYQPPLPVGAIRGDVSRQNYGLNCPQYYYIDIKKHCIQCRQEFLFSAKEQKFWYEKLKFYFESTAIRCMRCRKQRRSGKMLRQQIAAINEKLRENPNEPGLLIELCTALLLLRERCHAGDLDKAIAAARKAQRVLREAPHIKLLPRALFAEARCHAFLERKDKARGIFTEFLKSIEKRKKGFRKEIQWTNEWIAKHSKEST
ncbi:MAG: zinc-ribbon domain containing protein [Calditrichia bacterium]